MRGVCQNRIRSKYSRALANVIVISICSPFFLFCLQRHQINSDSRRRRMTNTMMAMIKPKTMSTISRSLKSKKSSDLVLSMKWKEKINIKPYFCFTSDQHTCCFFNCNERRGQYLKCTLPMTHSHVNHSIPVVYVYLAILPWRSIAEMVRVCVPLYRDVSNTCSKAPACILEKISSQVWLNQQNNVLNWYGHSCLSHGWGGSSSTWHVSDSNTLSVSHVMLTFSSGNSSSVQVSSNDRPSYDQMRGKIEC